MRSSMHWWWKERVVAERRLVMRHIIEWMRLVVTAIHTLAIEPTLLEEGCCNGCHIHVRRWLGIS